LKGIRKNSTNFDHDFPVKNELLHFSQVVVGIERICAIVERVHPFVDRRIEDYPAAN
jgi:hypothetical protein